MKTVASKMLFTFLSVLLVMLFLSGALLIGHRTVGIAQEGQSGWIFIILAICGLATSLIKDSGDTVATQYQDKEEVNDLFHGVLK
jgi:hypothetical protein